MLQLSVVLVFLCTQRRRDARQHQLADKEKAGATPEQEKLPLLTGSFDSSYGSEGSGSNSELVVW